ncbi:MULTISPECIES: LLM class flavin-dependent oxidoreductase [Bacillaceae]|uniref:LLM class flavin-dependent oxidoreductase n=1 Tax=Bacillaceae TaxID=186817 RepID=UPI000BFB645F|nr:MULTISPECIES: LLM class flavin-dependent oxidoreductase [Bacillaceae]PGT75642.1 LLM class flavin-dependent oxidoreductase [Bacillus sp. AFS040349]UGB28837.1 LLM class flavin-dependent oxidoreductase [Metabacillus sp. B2-18]
MIKRLSILDMAPVDYGTTGKEALLNTLHLAKQADKLGYERFWVTEHHNISTVASASPEMLIGQILAVTNRIRVGSGGVMLPNHSPLKVAENFKLLEAFYSGRIDLGIGRAPGSSSLSALALRRSKQPYNADDLQALLHELVGYDANQQIKKENPFSEIVAMPEEVPLPPIWLLGSSSYSAQLASAEALSYSFAYHFNPTGAKEAISLYRNLYRRNHGLDAPPVILGLSVISGETVEEVAVQKKVMSIKHLQNAGALRNVDLSNVESITIPPQLQLMSESYLSTLVIGTWDDLKKKLDALSSELNVEELIITTTQRGFDTRIKLYEKLAEFYGLNKSKY